VIQAPNLPVSLSAIAEPHPNSLRLGFVPRSLPECLALTNEARIPQRVQIFFPAIEPNVNTIAASILGESSMKWLVDVTDQMGDEPNTGPLLIPWRIGRLKHLGIPGKRFDNTVAQFAIALLVIGVGVFFEVDVVIQVHVRDLATGLVGPSGCFG
jgi:hypothetical protein